MEGYSNYNWQWYDSGADERRQEYRRLIHDLSKKLSHENVQSISFLRRSSTDCCAAAGHYPAACAMAQPPPAHHGLQVLEHLLHSGVFSETNPEPLVQLLRDIGRHDLANECQEKSSKLYSDLHRYRHVHGNGAVNWSPQMQMPPIGTPPTLLPSPAEYRDCPDSNDRIQPSSGNPTPEQSPASEKKRNFPSDTKMSQQDILSTASKPTGAASAIPTGLIDEVSKSGISSGQISKSIPSHDQNYFNSIRSNTATPQLSTTAPDARHLDLESSISLHLNKTEIDKLLRCNPDPTLKEKLLTAASSYHTGESTFSKDGCSHYGERRGVISGEPIPKVIMNSGMKMRSEASNFDSQTSGHFTKKVLLRRQQSILHVRNIETPIPAPLTPQPQKSHMKLEARSSNTSTGSSDTDSGLSQCHSHRSSTVSNASSSDAFLSEEEETDLKEEDHSHSTRMVGASSQRKDNGVGSSNIHHQVAVDEQSRSDRLQAKQLAERDKRHSAHKTAGPGPNLLTKQKLDGGVNKLRRQSESTRDVIADRRDKHESRRGGHPISLKRNRAISLPEFPPPNPLAKTGMTIDWRLPRDDFIDPIFHHKNKTFERKCRFSTGSGSSILNVQLAIRLYPNGINWDQGSYSTLKVEITNTSRPPPPTAYIQFDITGYDCHAGHMIASRQVEYPLKHKEFLIPEFLSHEVIKVSHAKNFEFRATIRIKYLVCSDWVVIPPDPVGL